MREGRPGATRAVTSTGRGAGPIDPRTAAPPTPAGPPAWHPPAPGGTGGPGEPPAAGGHPRAPRAPGEAPASAVGLDGVTSRRDAAGPAPAPGPGTRGRLASYLPDIDALDDESFRERHTLLCWILGLHVPLLVAFGVWQGTGGVQSVAEAAVPAACLVAARLLAGRRATACLVATGLVASSTALAYLAGGSIEARFHVFVVIALVGLYRDWAVLAWAAASAAVTYLLGIALDAHDVFNHPAAQDNPVAWTLIHLLAVLAACGAVALGWHVGSTERHRVATSATRSADAEVAMARAEAAQRTTVSGLLVHLARRNQALLDRQLELIAELEQQESTPEALADLFRLDHLATRIRRNAESLLVLSGEDPPRSWGRPVPLGEVVRAAAAEVEDYERVEALVDDRLDVAGRVVADLAHLLAELIENATTFSPADAEVRVRSHLAPGEPVTYVVSIEDTGPGMPPAALDAANRLLAEPPAVDLTHGTLGFQVVARLARRYRLQVRLTETPGGGLTALVTLPADVVAERAAEAGQGFDASPPLRPGAGPPEWRLPDADALAQMVATTPPEARRPAGDGRGLRGMAIPRLRTEEAGAPPAPWPSPAGPANLGSSAPPTRGAAGAATPVPPAMGPAAPPAMSPPTAATPDAPAPPAPVEPPAPPAGAGRPASTGAEGPGTTPAPTAPRGRRLTRRVPGEGLRQLAGDDTPRERPAAADPPLDVERMRSMLSRLQGHRAGRSDKPPATPPGPGA
jgi:signal transduction histidine kinase